MLSKKYRLTEKDVKKVLRKWKPFFSHEIVLNIMKNNYNYNRFAIIIWSKSVDTNVDRNYFRRKFYDFVWEKVFYKWWNDLVFVVKKTYVLTKKNNFSLETLIKNLSYLLNKI